MPEGRGLHKTARPSACVQAATRHGPLNLESVYRWTRSFPHSFTSTPLMPTSKWSTDRDWSSLKWDSLYWTPIKFSSSKLVQRLLSSVKHSTMMGFFMVSFACHRIVTIFVKWKNLIERSINVARIPFNACSTDLLNLAGPNQHCQRFH